MEEEIFEQYDIDNVQEVDNAQEEDNVQEEDNEQEDNVQEEDNALEEDNVQEKDNEQEDNMQEKDNALEEDNVQEEDNEQEEDNVQEKDNALKEEDNAQEEDNASENIRPLEEIHESENNLVISENEKWPGWPGENVFRMLVTVQKIGGIIGHKGEYIQKICEETKDHVKIFYGPPGTTEGAVLISAKEEPDLDIPPAMDGLLKIHKRMLDVDSESANTQSGTAIISTRLLVARAQAWNLIGKKGATIKSIQESSGCNIQVLRGDHLSIFALADDTIVDIWGEPVDLHNAIELIAAHLRKFLVDRSVVGVFEVQIQMSNRNMPPLQSWGPLPQAFPMSAGGGAGYGPTPQYIPPSPLHFGPPYGIDASVGAHMTSFPSQQPMVTKVTHNMQISLSYAAAVIGTSGSNISYIWRSSGANITIQENAGAPGEMTVVISGSASQVEAAQQLIQNFKADAARSVQNSAGGPPSQGDYSSV